MKTLVNIFGAVSVVLFMAACADKPHYVHEESKARPIPAAASVSMPEVIEEERSRGNLVIEDEESQSADVGVFVSKYNEKKSPKFIVYVNKELSEDVSVVGAEGRISFKSDTNSSNWLFQAVKVTSQPQKESRYFKRFMDKIEKGYISAFLEYKVRVLDRSYMLRNQELKFDKEDQRKAFSILEMSALKEQADVFISVIPSFSRDKVEINVKAMNLQDGQILVEHTEDLINGSVRQIVLTDKGYEVVKSVGDLEKKMANIAKETMYNIGKVW